MTRIGVIGAGRVGAVLAAGFAQAGHEIVAVAGESSASRTRAATLLPGVPLKKPTDVAKAADVVFLTVPDDMLANLVTMLANSGALRPGQIVLHTSGRHGLAVLEPARQVGAQTIAFHPALTFTGTDLDLKRLPECVVGLTADEDMRDFAEGLVADLGARPMWVQESARTLYHAALAHGSNHLVTLVTEAMEILNAAGASDPAGTLRPLLMAALENALENGDAALTGPMVRGDVGTISAHLSELEKHAPQTVPTYVALAKATMSRVLSDGRLLPIRGNTILRVLNRGLQAPAAAHPTRPTR